MRWVSRLITFVVIVAAAAGILVFIRGRLPKTTIGEKFTTYAKFRDASKLVVGSPVVIAGVRIGEVTQLAIEGRMARVDMLLKDNSQIGVDWLVTKRAPSTFGDSYLEIVPGAAEGAANERLLVSGQPLTHVLESSSTDSVLRATERSMPQLEAGIESLGDFMTNARSYVNGQVVSTLDTASTWLDEGHLQKPLASTDRALDRIEDATAAATRALGATNGDPSTSIQARLATFDGKVTAFRGSLGKVRSGLTDGLTDARTSLGSLDEQLAAAKEVASAVNEGRGDDWKGKLGRLVNDGELADDLEDGTAAVRDGTASLDRFKAYLGARIELNVRSRQARTYVTAEIRARDDKFYLLELEKGLLGGAPSDALTDAAGTTGYTRTAEIQDKLRFTAQYGRVWGPLTLRIGLKENSAGAGADWMAGRLQLSADLFGGFKTVPDLKMALSVMLFRSVYLVGGVDDALQKGGSLAILEGNTTIPNQFENVRYGRDYFFGAMLKFDDADITAILRVYGALLAAAAI